MTERPTKRAGEDCHLENPGDSGPPHTAARLLRMILPDGGRDHLLDELHELYGQRRRRGKLRANMWYWRVVAGFGWRLAAERIRVGATRMTVASEALVRDGALAVRSLLRRPGYLVATVTVLGLGIGGVATVYTAANWVLLRPVPGVGSPGELVRIQVEYTDRGVASRVTHPDFLHLAAGTPSLSGVAAVLPRAANLAGVDGSNSRRIRAELVTANFFRVLDVSPAVGRFFDPADHRGSAGPAEMVVGHGLWVRQWGGDPAAVGTEVLVNGRSVTVIGVAPEGFRGDELPGEAEAWFPESAAEVLIRGEPSAADLDGARFGWSRLVGRLRPGASPSQTQVEAQRVGERIEASGAPSSFILPGRMGFRVHQGIGLSPGSVPDVRRTVLIVGSGALFLLVLAVANVANLGLARAASRREAAAIRRALGAGSARVVREPLLEGAVVGGAGATLGLFVTALGTRAFRDTSLDLHGATLEGMVVDGRVVAFAVAVALVAGLLSAVVPARLLGGESVIDRLRGGGPSDRSGSSVRSGLVTVQVLLSMVLLVGGGLFARTVANLGTVDLGLELDRVSTFAVDPATHGWDVERTAELRGRIRRTLLAEPGVEAVAFMDPAALRGWSAFNQLYPEGEGSEGVAVAEFSVTPEIFDVLGLPLLAGRSLPDRAGDAPPDSGAVPPVVLSRAAVRVLDRDATPAAMVGRTVRAGWRPEPVRVVGVVEDSRVEDVIPEPGPVIFVPLQRHSGVLTSWARTRHPSADALPGIVSTVRAVVDGLPVFDATTGPGLVAERLSERRLLARLGVVLAAIGLVLAATGLYGVLAYAVVERTREIGIRIALGVGPRRLLLGVVGRGLLLVTAGALPGLVAAGYLTRFVRSRLFGVDALDPVTYLTGFGLMAIVGALASWLPARRALRISPTDALRGEGG